MPARARSDHERLIPVQSILRELHADIGQARAELDVLRATAGFAPGMGDRVEALARSLAAASQHLNDVDQVLAAAAEAPVVNRPVEPIEQDPALRLSHTRHVKPRPDATLTPRETEVAALLGHGLSNRQIAVELVISLATARVHVDHIMAKLDVHSRGQVAFWA